MTSRSTTHTPQRNTVSSLVIVCSLVVWAVLAGFWGVFGALTTFAAALLFPPALGLPTLVPPLRVSPLGETSTLMWAAESTGVLVMLCAAILWVRSAVQHRPVASRRRVFGRAVHVTVAALVCGNIARYLFHSVIMPVGPVTFVGQLLGTVLVSTLIGVVLGLIAGVFAAVVHPSPEEVQAPGVERAAGRVISV